MALLGGHGHTDGLCWGFGGQIAIVPDRLTFVRPDLHRRSSKLAFHANPKDETVQTFSSDISILSSPLASSSEHANTKQIVVRVSVNELVVWIDAGESGHTVNDHFYR